VAAQSAKALIALLAAAAAALCAACASLPRSDWPQHGLDAAETRFSPLASITPDTVARLGPVWFAELSAISTRAFEATPIVVDGRLYVSTGWSVVLAYDARSGRKLWHFDPGVPKAVAGKGCCGPVSRGVAVADGKVFLAAFDGRLIALAADTGRPLWTVQTVDTTKDYTVTGAPRVIGHRVLIGNGGAELGVRGYLSAYDTETGRLAWRFYTVPPRPGTADGAVSDGVLAGKAAATWSGRWWEWGGGGTVWDAMAYDPGLDLLYVGVGNGGPWNRQLRSDGRGDNLFLSSILALRPATGEYVWHFQETPGDEWDYTATQSIILADLKIDGRVRKVLMQAPKNGFFYVLDRASGELLSGTPYVPVSWAKGLDPQSGRPLEDPAIRYSENAAPSAQQPGPLGGHNWHPMSYSPATGLVYIPAIHAGFNYVAAGAGYHTYPSTPNMGIDPLATAVPEDPQVIAAARASVGGELLAWDPVARKPAWSVPLPVAWNGGTLATAGGLVFQGDAQGNLSAYDARSGRRCWSLSLGAGIVAPPISYGLDGRQYIAVAVGWGGGLPQVAGALTSEAKSTGINRLVVLALDGKAELPAVVATRAQLAPPPATAPAATVAAGKALYERRCYHCHGGAVISGGEVPDLRYSRLLGDAAAFAAVVQDGALAVNGMPDFASGLSAADVDAIRAYVIARANADARAAAAREE
jgi:PQQ-dependent dehydrogenase (methanol/ethanol family)